MSTFTNICSETTGPIKVKFHMEPPWQGETKVCWTVPGHTTKMAAMPIYGKNLKKSSSSEPNGQWPWNLVCCMGCLSTTKFVQLMTLDWPWLFYWSLTLLYGKKVKKKMDFSETIVVYDVKVGRGSLLNDYMNLYEYQRSRSFIDLDPRSLRFNIFKFLFLFLFLRNCLTDWSQILCGASMGWINESLIKRSGSHDQGGRHGPIW